MKRCSKCGDEKSLTEYYRHSGSRDGLKGYCKVCGRAASGEYYREHAAEQNAKSSAKHRADPSAKASYDREYRAKHKQALSKKRRAYEVARQATGWVRPAADPAVVRVRSARWYAANADHAKRRVSQYRRANKDKHVAWGEAYRAKRRAVGAGVTARQWLALRTYFGDRCLSCDAQAPLTMDHVQPLSLSGPHDISNVQLLCKSCNSRKQRKVIDYRPAGWEAFVAELGEGAVIRQG